MNQPESWESVYLDHDERLIDFTPDTKLLRAGTYTIRKQDHTLGNVLRMQLLRNTAEVLFAGYKVPHPLEPQFVLKIQTAQQAEPEQVLTQAIAELQEEMSVMRDSLAAGMQQVRSQQAQAQAQAMPALGGGRVDDMDF